MDGLQILGTADLSLGVADQQPGLLLDVVPRTYSGTASGRMIPASAYRPGPAGQCLSNLASMMTGVGGFPVGERLILSNTTAPLPE
jgi:hypothetical protein